MATGNDVSGYNCGQVEALRDVINTTAQNAGQNIVEILHNKIIVPMSSRWYAPEAVQFFDGFKQTVAASGEAITQAFDGFRASVEAAGANWAENTGGQSPVLAAIDTVVLDLNTSEILPDNAGNVTIDESGASQIASSLADVEQEIKEDLKGLAGQLNAETAFIGHNQASSLQECFVEVSGAIHKVFQYLTEGEDSLQSQINKAVQKYQDVSEGISSAFNTVNVDGQ